MQTLMTDEQISLTFALRGSQYHGTTFRQRSRPVKTSRISGNDVHAWYRPVLAISMLIHINLPHSYHDHDTTEVLAFVCHPQMTCQGVCEIKQKPNLFIQAWGVKAKTWETPCESHQCLRF